MDQSSAPLIVPELPSCELLSVRVLKIFDGDGLLGTIRHPVTERDLRVPLRFGFIDAPEMGQYGGQEAKDFLTLLIGGQWIEISVLTKMDTGGITDRHGRIVCVPYLTHMLDSRAAVPALAGRLWQPISFTRNIELEMVVNGWDGCSIATDPMPGTTRRSKRPAATGVASGRGMTTSIRGNSKNGGTERPSGGRTRTGRPVCSSRRIRDEQGDCRKGRRKCRRPAVPELDPAT